MKQSMGIRCMLEFEFSPITFAIIIACSLHYLLIADDEREY